MTGQAQRRSVGLTVITYRFAVTKAELRLFGSLQSSFLTTTTASVGMDYWQKPRFALSHCVLQADAHLARCRFLCLIFYILQEKNSLCHSLFSLQPEAPRCTAEREGSVDCGSYSIKQDTLGTSAVFFTLSRSCRRTVTNSRGLFLLRSHHFSYEDDIGLLYEMLSGLLKKNILQEKSYYCLADAALAIFSQESQEEKCYTATAPVSSPTRQRRFLLIMGAKGSEPSQSLRLLHQDCSGSADSTSFSTFSFPKTFSSMYLFIYLFYAGGEKRRENKSWIIFMFHHLWFLFLIWLQ